MEAWISAGAGLLGVLIGTGIGAYTTWKVQRTSEAEQRRQRSAGMVGRLKTLIDFYTPGRWVIPPEVLDEVMNDLAIHEKQWYDISPDLLSLPVFFPTAFVLVETIYKEMNGLTRGVWNLARSSARTFGDIDEQLKTLVAQQASLRSAVDELIGEMWDAG